MKHAEIKVGSFYKAKVGANVTTVRVDKIGTESTNLHRKPERYVYHVTNLATGRKTVFRSAQKFREEVKQEAKYHQCQCEVSEGRPQGLQVICLKCGGETAHDVVPPAKQLGGQHAASQTTDCPPLEDGRPFAGDPSASTSTAQPTGSVTGASRLTTNDGSGVSAGATLGSALRSVAAPAKSNGQAPHLIVMARAGTGKTTTLVEGLKELKGISSKLTPSPQQRAVWDSICLSRGVNTVGFVAFNKSIATELQLRVPAGCDAMTMHSLGYKAVRKALGRVDLNEYVVADHVCDLIGMDARDARKECPIVLQASTELVGLCKMNLVHPWDCSEEEFCEELSRLASHYDVDLNGSRERVFRLVPQVLERCRNPRGRIDFDDMIWLPVVLQLPVFKYDLLLIDESQDLNRCQQALAKVAGKRLILVGDDRQAIYGFCGADSESLHRMAQELPGCVTLPLTVTRRCGKAIVEEARKLVPDFEAHESNGIGKIASARWPMQGDGENKKELPWEQTYCAEVTPGDMVLCRVNAPLVGQCFRFLKRGIKANIQGRDIGRGLIALAKKLKAATVPELIGKLSDWLHQEQAKENAKRNPNENKLIALQDKHDCIVAFAEHRTTIDEVLQKIDSVFTDDKKVPGVRFSSIHKSKGLEAEHVFFLVPKSAPCPHPLAKKEWAKKQELNLRYVAITRAIKVLTYVS